MMNSNTHRRALLSETEGDIDYRTMLIMLQRAQQTRMDRSFAACGIDASGMRPYSTPESEKFIVDNWDDGTARNLACEILINYWEHGQRPILCQALPKTENEFQEQDRKLMMGLRDHTSPKLYIAFTRYLERHIAAPEYGNFNN